MHQFWPLSSNTSDTELLKQPCRVFFSVRYLIYLVFLQDNGLRGNTGYPRDGWRVIPAFWKRAKHKVRSKKSCYVSSQVLIPGVFGWVSMVRPRLSHPPISSWLPAWLGSPASPPQPPLRCAQPSLVLQWFLGGEEIVIMVFHVIHLHVPGPFCPQELLSFREQHAKESEQTQVRLVKQHKEKERKKRTRWLTGGVRNTWQPRIQEMALWFRELDWWDETLVTMLCSLTFLLLVSNFYRTLETLEEQDTTTADHCCEL